MSLIKNIGRSYYKSRIIFTFSLITIIIVVILSRIGYLFIKDLYLIQLQEQVNIVARMIARQVDPSYLNLLELGTPSGTTEIYFKDLFKRNLDPKLHSEIFIFNDNLNVIIHSNKNFIYGETEPGILINKKEIFDLKLDSGIASLPFKGDDGNWYLWGFFKLNNNHWLAARESAARFEKLEQLSTLFWLIGFGGVAVTILAGFFMANSITKPLNKLVSLSTEIGKGNFNAEIPDIMHGEIKLLSDAMSKMKNDLGENQKERENLLAQIAHEIRNPLGGIELLANLVKENQADSEKNSEYLSDILKEVQGLKLLITSYLNFSRPVPSDPGWVNVEKLLPEIESIFTKEINAKNIFLSYNVKENKIWFDYAHLKNILINLVANSLDSVSANGNIIIASERNHRYWLLSVKDNGNGIKQEDINKIFNPFFTTKKNGTGLGLAISKKLCKENKAELIALNNPGNGSTFIIKKEIINEL